MPQSHYSLAFQTVLSKGEICLLKDQSPIGGRTWSGATRHSENLSFELVQLLNEHELKIQDILELFCVVGPGSFTGIRVSVAFCRALGQSLIQPITPLNSLRLLAEQCRQTGHILAALDAQKNSVYLSLFERQSDGLLYESKVKNQVVPLNELSQYINSASVYLCGDILNRYQNHLPSSLTDKFVLQKEWQDIDLYNYFNKVKVLPAPEPWLNLQPFYIKRSAPEELLQTKKEHLD